MADTTLKRIVKDGLSIQRTLLSLKKEDGPDAC